MYAFGLEEHVYNGTGSNVSNTSYYSLGGRLIGKFDGANTQYYLTDAQGSVLTTFGNAATTTSVLGNQTYGPYGNTLSSSGSIGTAKGFTGQYQDPSGLDYYNARYYDPVIGRFISADTVQGNAQGMDPYTYVNGNPETLTDPTGQLVRNPCSIPDNDCGPPPLLMHRLRLILVEVVVVVVEVVVVVVEVVVASLVVVLLICKVLLVWPILRIVVLVLPFKEAHASVTQMVQRIRSETRE